MSRDSERESRWTRLEELLRRPHRGRRRLTPDEAAEIATLYRQAASDLAEARRSQPDLDTTHYLNDLVMRTHTRLYRPARGDLRGVWRFLRDGFPALIAQYRRVVLLAFALTVLGAAIGFAAVSWDPNLAEAFVPQQMRQEAAKPLTGELASMGSSPIMSTTIMTNNMKVGVLAFGLGLTFGIGTTYILLTNGLTLGALGAVYFRAGLSVAFWATILPHGVIELTAIFLSGAAGFVLAGALIRPGTLPRRQALARAGRDAAGLALGTIPMYVVAGIIEGFITPRGIPHGWKLAVAAVTAVVLLPYLVRWRRPAATAVPAV
ncbi:MAG: putative chromate reductase [Firmicutes bacterium]|nr:putative chromate reductase [Bacillota bacterium]